jgi:glycyl-tRNA synthetase
MAKMTISELAAFAKKTGYVYPAAEIYGGLSGFYDYGPYGVELKNNLKNSWWTYYVWSHDNVVGLDSSIITNPKVWKASGHEESFNDYLIDCKKCKFRIRADHLIEDTLEISAESFSPKKIDSLVREHKIKCPKCKKSELTNTRTFNTMFKTHVGPLSSESEAAYLRPETAQSIFANFAVIQRAARLRLPFGIAQIGKAFRDEIAPRDFLFRQREFEQLEIEFFINPKKTNQCDLYNLVESDKTKVPVWTEKAQLKDKEETLMTFNDLYEKKIVKNKWHAYWIYHSYHWLTKMGLSPKNLRLRPHLKDELSFYSKATIDIEYKYPFGWKELQGIADRSQYDLKQHMDYSNKDLTYLDVEKNERVTPYVIEPSLGLDRVFLAVLYESYTKQKKKGKERVFLKLNTQIAPIKIAILPIVKNNKDLVEKAQDIYKDLRGLAPIHYTGSGTIGKRYAIMDEVGTPFCVTIDAQTLKDNTVTLRDRDTTEQRRVKIEDILIEVF